MKAIFKINYKQIITDPILLAILAILLIVLPIIGIIGLVPKFISIVDISIILIVLLIILLFARKGYGAYVDNNRLIIIYTRTGFDRQIKYYDLPVSIVEVKTTPLRIIGVGLTKIHMGTYAVGGYEMPLIAATRKSQLWLKKVYVVNNEIALYSDDFEKIIPEITKFR